MRASAFACFWFACGAAFAGTSYSFHVAGDEPGSWPAVLGSVGMVADGGALTNIFVFPAASEPDPQQWMPRIEQGAYVILEGDSPLARSFGISPGQQRVPVRSLIDEHNPRLPVVWEHSLELPVYSMPAEARVFAKERWKGYPLLAGFRKGNGAVLWIAAAPGQQGYERFPYLLQALTDLGSDAPFRSARLWAFLDSSYRSRVDVDYFARRWRKSGIAALHIAAWHYYEPDAERDKWLRGLIEACHRNAILVYAWVELPHVSEKFWQEHPEWREKTAIGQDAHLDWRKLMNLSNRDCFRSVSEGMQGLLTRFDWDGINLAELYFESLHGWENAARFTPMNADVRAEFKQRKGFDPADLFTAGAKNEAGMRAFLDYRADLTQRMQHEWIAEMEKVRRKQPHLELVLTHVDDRFDTSMRDKIGADAAALLPSVETRDVTFLIEDPATVWNLGPQRYPEIRRRYEPLTKRAERLAIDINIVERYQDVYPTKQQTGTELFQLVHLAAGAFPRVALYFEQSIAATDMALLPSAAASVKRVEKAGGKLVVESAHGVGLRWDGGALVNGRAWPVSGDGFLLLPPGAVAVEPAPARPPLELLDCNAELKTASALADGVEFSYESRSRAYVVLGQPVSSVEVDGAPWEVAPIRNGDRYTLVLPRGQHLVTIRARRGSI